VPAGPNLDNQHADYTATKAARDKSRHLYNGIRYWSDYAARDPQIRPRAKSVAMRQAPRSFPCAPRIEFAAAPGAWYTYEFCLGIAR